MHSGAKGRERLQPVRRMREVTSCRFPFVLFPRSQLCAGGVKTSENGLRRGAGHEYSRGGGVAGTLGWGLHLACAAWARTARRARPSGQASGPLRGLGQAWAPGPPAA